MKIGNIPFKTGSSLSLIKEMVKSEVLVDKKLNNILNGMFGEEAVEEAIDSIDIIGNSLVVDNKGNNFVIIRIIEYGNSMVRAPKILSKLARKLGGNYVI